VNGTGGSGTDDEPALGGQVPRVRTYKRVGRGVSEEVRVREGVDMIDNYAIDKAKKLGRHYIGIDLNPDYCEMARKRLNHVEWPLDKILVEEAA